MTVRETSACFAGRDGLSLGRLCRLHADLTKEERRAIAEVRAKRIKLVAPRCDVIREGSEPGGLMVILSGWACRQKSLRDGRRQTLGILLAGDLCEPNIQLVRRMDHGVTAISHVTVAEIDRDTVAKLCIRYPRIQLALTRSVLANASMQREWILNVGQRTAREHISHLMAEMFHRLRAVCGVQGNTCAFPLTQSDIADATGLTVVHVNRVLQDLRREGLIELSHRTLHIPDLIKLERTTMFDPAYLHLEIGSEKLCGVSPLDERSAWASVVMPPQQYLTPATRSRSAEEVFA